MSGNKGRSFKFTETDIYNEVRSWLNKHSKEEEKQLNDIEKNLKIKKCTWTEVKISQNVKPYINETDARLALKHIIKRFYCQHYNGGLY